jgi:hypothetical protein
VRSNEIQKGTNKQKYLWSDPAINGVSRFFISPSLFVVVAVVFVIVVRLSFVIPPLSTLDFDFLLIGTMKMRTQDKSAKRQSNGNDQTM